MYITNSIAYSDTGGKICSEIINYFPESIRRYLKHIDLSGAYEIHMAADMPLCIYFPYGRRFISLDGELIKQSEGVVRITRRDIEKCIELVTQSSVYAVKEEIANGFVTIGGGHRVGISGSGVIRNGRVEFIKDISVVNFRIASEKIGAADRLMPYILKNDIIKSTLIISPPGAGKTTMLRDIARQLSIAGKRVSIVDERYEIAAMNGGKSAFDLGISCDVLSGVEKAGGMLMMLRSMSPEVIITDELGTAEDMSAVRKMLNCGVAVISSVHGSGTEERKRLLSCFDVAVSLSRKNGAGTIERIDAL